MIPDYFWAKTTENDNPAKSVLSHLNDVRAVAGLLLNAYKILITKTDCSTEQIASFAGLHDIGKISPGFQAKCSDWLTKCGLHANYGEPYEKDHSVVTQYTIQTILQKKGMKTEPAELWAAILGAHHGKLHRPGINLRVDDKEWGEKREGIIHDFFNNTPLPNFPIDDSWPFLWWLAGLVSVSDWIGSNEDWFPVAQDTTPLDSARNAVCAINSIAFDIPILKKSLSFGEIFQDKGRSFEPNDLQLKAVQTIQDSGLYILEAPMGMGKTEAALWCVYKLMSEGKASGFYFALPTQATSNRIHLRVNDFLDKVTEDKSRSRLIHSGSWLLDNIKVPTISETTKTNAEEKEEARRAIDWFASKKRGLLAPFGVGTIDQALMSVIAVKHFFVRQFALAGKVVILDEVHSYDMYTGTLIKTLCDRLLTLGCTVILLSATLTKGSKKRFVDVLDDANQEPYPVISGQNIKSIEVLKPQSKTILIKMKSESDSLSAAIEKAKQGASVLWVCDTVNKAQEMFDRAILEKQSNIEIGLLHARFPVFRRQELEEYWMEKLGKSNLERRGCILFSTQIVEQSVDLDADFMVSELAPTDMLLQRMGRLWRHRREGRPVDKPEMWIVAEDSSFEEFKKETAGKIKKMFGTKSAVYVPYVLLRSLELWKDKVAIELPDDIRNLLEDTYKINDNDPKGWQDLHGEIEGEGFALRQSAEFETNVWNLLLDDEEGKAKTRVNNLPTTQLILAFQNKDDTLPLLNGECIILKGDTFSLPDARSLARNIVKVPAYCFEGHSTNPRLKLLVRGDWQVGFIGDGGFIKCTYLKAGYELRYTPEKGVEIMKTDQKREVDHEPCD
ncbi:MAG: CRISPR-associated helicase Cas3' [Chitinispirillaceae bacterium]|nr:CRISPR-associated helicase Cas3' [Chitinispirillaceae bacterium]